MVSAIVSICVSAIFLQTISAQFRGPHGYPIPVAPVPEVLPNSLPYAMPIGEPIPYIPENAAVFNGGGFQVTSYSNVGPTGIKVQSDNLAVEGPLSVVGKLPFLGVVSVEGPLPAVGQGAVAYECGNGNVGIISEGNLGQEIGLPVGIPMQSGIPVPAGMPIPAGMPMAAGIGYNGVANGFPMARY